MRCDDTRSHVNRNKFLAVNTLDPEEEQEGEKPRDSLKLSWLLQSNKTDVTATTEKKLDFCGNILMETYSTRCGFHRHGRVLRF